MKEPTTEQLIFLIRTGKLSFSGSYSPSLRAWSFGFVVDTGEWDIAINLLPQKLIDDIPTETLRPRRGGLFSSKPGKSVNYLIQCANAGPILSDEYLDVSDEQLKELQRKFCAMDQPVTMAELRRAIADADIAATDEALRRFGEGLGLIIAEPKE